MSIQPTISLRLMKIIRMEIKLNTITGLLISAGKSLGRIGGADIEPISIERTYECEKSKVIVRVPYIPGSSLKGRMRSLLEVALGLTLFSTDGKIWAHTLSRKVYKDLSGGRLSDQEFVQILKDTELDRVFGYGAFPIDDVLNELKKNNQDQLMNSLLSVLTPTLLLVEDLFPENSYVCNIYKEKGLVTFDDFVEDKSENRIDRVTSAADPREIRRVKPGVPFTGSLSLLVYDKNIPKLKDHLSLLVKGMKLVEMTYLGAAGSRGYGRVKFTSINVKIFDPHTGTESSPVSFNSVDELNSKIDEIVKTIAPEQPGDKK